MAKLKIGQKVRFNPFADHHDKSEVVGMISFINHSHRYFTVDYEIDKRPFKTSFSFNDYYGTRNNVFNVKE